jgi:hypothetical protein
MSQAPDCWFCKIQKTVAAAEYGSDLIATRSASILVRNLNDGHPY